MSAWENDHKFVQLEGTIKLLYEYGLMTSHDLDTEHVGRNYSDKCRARIAAILIPTRDRHVQLLRCIQSIATNLEINGRKIPLIIADSSAHSHRQSITQQCNQVASRLGLRTTILTEDHKDRFLGVIQRAGTSKEVAELALLGDINCSSNYGANRNLLMMAAGRHQVVSSDDDVVWKTYLHRHREYKASGELTTSSCNPFDFDPSADSITLSTDPVDIIGSHEEWLGRPLTSLSNVEQVVRHFGSSSLYEGRITSTCGGFVGDSGMISKKSILLSDNPVILNRLAADKVYYRDLIGHRDLVSFVHQPTLTAGSPEQAIVCGRDYTKVPIPYFPVGRNEDGVNSFLTRLCLPTEYSLSLPFLVSHNAVSGRSDKDWVSLLTRNRISDVLIALAFDLATNTTYLSLNTMGSFLSSTRSLSQCDFIDLLLLSLTRFIARRIARMELIVNTFRHSHSDWHRIVESALRTQLSTFNDPRFAHPVDIMDDGSLTATRRILSGYGDLLQAWPHVWDSVHDGLDMPV